MVVKYPHRGDEWPPKPVDPWIALHRTLTWLYGDAEARKHDQSGDLEAWRRLGTR